MNQKERELIIISSIVGAIAGVGFRESYIFYDILLPEWLSLIITLVLLVIVLYFVLSFLEYVVVPLFKKIVNPNYK